MTGAAEWQGRVGRVWAEEATRTERAFAGIAATLDRAVAAMAPDSGAALDIGCGVGSTALALASGRPGLHVTGVDLSADLVEVATSRGAGVPNLRFVRADAVEEAGARAPLDLLVSRHGVMFFPDPAGAFARLRAAARPGAPLVFSCFRPRAENDWSRAVDEALGIVPAGTSAYAPGPYGFADQAFVAAMLAAAGWHDARAEAHDVSYVVGAGADPVADALAFYRRIGPAASALAAAGPDDRPRLEARLAAMLRERTRDDTVAFTAAIWIWRAEAGDKE